MHMLGDGVHVNTEELGELFACIKHRITINYLMRATHAMKALCLLGIGQRLLRSKPFAVYYSAHVLGVALLFRSQSCVSAVCCNGTANMK